MSSGLAARVIGRLDGESKDGDERWKFLVLAALDGPEALTTALAADATPKKQKLPPAPPPAKPRAAYLRSIKVEGFRGIGKAAHLDFPPGLGLTLVVRRNGSGKSSFAEALELLLTGDTFRWSQRAKVWRQDWRKCPRSWPS